MHEPFMHAISAASRANISEHQPHTLGNLARSLWVMRFSDRNFTNDMVELLLQGREGPSPLSMSAGGPPKTVFDVPGVTDQRFEGRIVRYREGSEFGFIHCPELFERYNKDVFAAGTFLEGRSAGEMVSFSVIFKKQGSPQAIDVEDADGVAEDGTGADRDA